MFIENIKKTQIFFVLSDFKFEVIVQQNRRYYLETKVSLDKTDL